MSVETHSPLIRSGHSSVLVRIRSEKKFFDHLLKQNYYHIKYNHLKKIYLHKKLEVSFYTT